MNMSPPTPLPLKYDCRWGKNQQIYHHIYIIRLKDQYELFKCEIGRYTVVFKIIDVYPQFIKIYYIVFNYV